jgi:hypothetical protein
MKNFTKKMEKCQIYHVDLYPIQITLFFHQKFNIMTDKQNAKRNMHQAVLLVLDDNTEIYSKVPAFNDAANELKELNVQIEETVRKQSKTAVKGSSGEKSDAETVLVTETVKAANALYSMAMRNSNPTLLAKVTISKGIMYRAQNNEKVSTAKRIASAASENAPALEYYGIDSAALDALNTAIAQYEKLIAKPRTVISETKQATANLVHLFARADTILNDHLDKLMSLFKTSAPDFYAIYFNARNIINTAGRSRKQDN